MIPVILATIVACAPATVDRWTHAPADITVEQRLAILPVKPCRIEGATGSHICSRKKGCLNERS
jgi:hypothetical protein